MFRNFSGPRKAARAEFLEVLRSLPFRRTAKSDFSVFAPRKKKERPTPGFFNFQFLPSRNFKLKFFFFFFLGFFQRKIEKIFLEREISKTRNLLHFSNRISSPFPNENLERKFFLIFFLELKIYKLEFLGKNDLKNF